LLTLVAKQGLIVSVFVFSFNIEAQQLGSVFACIWCDGKENKTRNRKREAYAMFCFHLE